MCNYIIRGELPLQVLQTSVLRRAPRIEIQFGLTTRDMRTIALQCKLRVDGAVSHTTRYMPARVLATGPEWRAAPREGGF
eukprot:COSAG06_NODE_275_length_18581_cov_31.316145_12_plen_80_part_00